MTFKKGSTDPCKQEASNIQACLTRNNFKQDKCRDEIEKLRQCCRELFEKNANIYESACCSGFVQEIEQEKKSKKSK